MTMPENTPGPDPWAPPAEDQPHDRPPFAYPAMVPPAPGQTGNGLGVAALTTGIIGTVLGFIPFLFWLSGILGVLALIFGLVGHSRARKGLATHKGMALAGAVLGGLTMVLAVVGLFLTVLFVKNAVDDARAKNREWHGPTAAPSDPGADRPLRFGRPRRYEDGVTITVGKPEPYRPDSVAVGHEKGDLAVRLKVTIVNGGKKPIDITSALPSVRDADGAPAGNIFDGNGATKPFSGTLLPGKRAVSQFSYSVSPGGAKELQLEVSPDGRHEDAIWTGPAR
ncbi:DUF4190 domain-containing protein [Streptomyces sp. BP-8]|uniref:DUF4190 domain-containing protein n=1 Tax=Streptomyces sirii TaxID=3127701 RepID=A0ABZ2QNY9_9ACTN